MKKLNNKGFAITGILYTLLVIFLLVLLFSIEGMRSNKAILARSTQLLEETYEGKKIQDSDITDINITDINSILAKLRTKKKTDPDNLEGSDSEEDIQCDENTTTCHYYEVPYTGKYVFTIKVKNVSGTDEEYKCSTYLEEKTAISFKPDAIGGNDKGTLNIVFTPDLCNRYNVKMVAEEEEEEADPKEKSGNYLILKEIYKFK